MSGSEGAGSRQRGPATRHVAMRLQHLKQIAGTLPTDDPARGAAMAVIVAEVERLHWRIWNGKAKDAQISIDRIRAVMHHFRGEPDQRRSTAPSRKLWTALHALDGYLTGQSAWLVNYAERHRAGLRVGTAITEGTANFLVNRRMNKSQQMRWSRRGADLLLQVRCAVYKWHARFRLRTAIPASQRSIPANGDRSLTPNLAAVPLTGLILAMALVLAVSWLAIRSTPFAVDRRFRVLQFVVRGGEPHTDTLTGTGSGARAGSAVERPVALR